MVIGEEGEDEREQDGSKLKAAAGSSSRANFGHTRLYFFGTRSTDAWGRRLHQEKPSLGWVALSGSFTSRMSGKNSFGMYSSSFGVDSNGVSILGWDY